MEVDLEVLFSFYDKYCVFEIGSILQMIANIIMKNWFRLKNSRVLGQSFEQYLNKES